MISCTCGEHNFSIIERDNKAIIKCSGCGRDILETDKCNLNLEGFESESDTQC